MEKIIVKNVENLTAVMNYLKNNSSMLYKQVTDITAVDWIEGQSPNDNKRTNRGNTNERFQLVYNLLSIRYNKRLQVNLFIDELTPVPSITPIFRGANWLEREVWDMFGIYFQGHPDLRRILTDYGFEGHPLRKEFPLTGYLELRYDESSKRVVSDPVEVAQEFRTFDFVSPWNPSIGHQK